MGCSGKNHPKIIKYFHPLNLEIRLIIIIVNAVLGLRYFQKCSIITMDSNLKFTWLFYQFQIFKFFMMTFHIQIMWKNGTILEFQAATILSTLLSLTRED